MGYRLQVFFVYKPYSIAGGFGALERRSDRQLAPKALAAHLYGPQIFCPN